MSTSNQTTGLITGLLGALPGITKTVDIEPCIVVIEKIETDKAVTYDREDLGTVTNSDGSEEAEWKTHRRYASREEAEKVTSVYGKVRTRLHSVCSKTDLGFVCAASRVNDLAKAIDEATQLVNEANQSLVHCHIRFRVNLLELQPDNEGGAATLRDAIVTQTEEIKEALQQFDVRKARRLLGASKNLSDTLSDSTARAALNAVREEAKDLATEIAKVIKEFGSPENAAATSEGKKILHRTQAPWQIF